MAKVSLKKTPSKITYKLYGISQKSVKLDVGFFDSEEAQKAYYNEFKDVAGWYDGAYETGVTRPFLFPVMKNEIKFVYEYIKNAFKTLDFENSEDVMRDVGEYLVSKTKEYMLDGEFKQNADSTVEKKGRNEPLIDQGDMYKAVTFKVTSKNNPGSKSPKS